jgi:mono/diheme cytochrome c family protein
MDRTIIKALAAGVSAVLILVSGVVLRARQQPEQQVAPVFTSQQADAGRVAYAKNCASCHMPDLSGDNERPPLVGTSFMTTWGGRTTKEFLTYMSGAMPYGAPALDGDTYAALTAYILRFNGATAGTEPLSASTDVLISSVTASHSTSLGGAETSPR